MQIIVHELGPVATHAYLLLPPGRDDAVLVDAPPGVAAAIAPELAKHHRRLTTLLLTHGHWDHLAEAAGLRAAGAVVYAHRGDQRWLENPMMQASFMPPGCRIEPVRVDHWLAPGEDLLIAGLRLAVRHVPGHAPGSVLFYDKESQCAFVGDTLFAGSVGRCDLPGGDWAQLEKSIREQIYTLPGDTVLHPGHGPRTTVARERASNRFVSG